MVFMNKMEPFVIFLRYLCIQKTNIDMLMVSQYIQFQNDIRSRIRSKLNNSYRPTI